MSQPTAKKRVCFGVVAFVAISAAILLTRFLAGFETIIPPRDGDLAFMFWVAVGFSLINATIGADIAEECAR